MIACIIWNCCVIYSLFISPTITTSVMWSSMTKVHFYVFTAVSLAHRTASRTEAPIKYVLNEWMNYFQADWREIDCSLLKHLQRRYHHFSENEFQHPINFSCQKVLSNIQPKSFLKQFLSLPIWFSMESLDCLLTVSHKFVMRPS